MTGASVGQVSGLFAAVRRSEPAFRAEFPIQPLCQMAETLGRAPQVLIFYL